MWNGSEYIPARVGENILLNFDQASEIISLFIVSNVRVKGKCIIVRVKGVAVKIMRPTFKQSAPVTAVKTAVIHTTILPSFKFRETS